MKQFKNLCSGYAQAYNKMYNRKGALFFDYIKRKKVQEDVYFGELVRYIHLNPVYHSFCKNLFEWPFSSINAFVSDRKTLISREEVWKWFGNRREFEKYHQVSDFNIDIPLIEL